MGMTQMNAFAPIANASQFFATLTENARYAVTTDTGRTRTINSLAGARRFAEIVATRNGGRAEISTNGQTVAVAVNRIGWCSPTVA